MTNRARDANAFGGAVGKEFDVYARAQTQMGNCEEAHSEIAEIDAEGIELGGSGEHLHRCVQQLTRAATPVWLEGAFENHSLGS